MVGAYKSRFLWQTHQKSPGFDENIIFSTGLCCHFALDTFPKTCLKDVVVDIDVRQNKMTKT